MSILRRWRNWRYQMTLRRRWRDWHYQRDLRKLAIWRYTWKQRRRTDEVRAFPWHLYMVPKPGTRESRGEFSEVWKTAVFVVHGIGTQEITETAALLRSGFDNILEKLVVLSKEGEQSISPPFVRDGYWANYSEIEKNFTKEWRRFSEESQKFFANLWKRRLFSVPRTILWSLSQPARLLFNLQIYKHTAWWKVPFLYLLYAIMLVPVETILIAAMIFYPRIVRGFLTDLRLYLRPKGVTEKAIVQRIDFTVRQRFMKTLGLDWDFRKLNEKEMIDITREKVAFDKVVWVAHSLGTVISYNVISDLVMRADEIEQMEDKAERIIRIEGVRKFRTGIKRFVTLGSPLDKIALLYPERISPWDERIKILDKSDASERGDKAWWINCYHVLDPVSGTLGAKSITQHKNPANFHIGFRHLPGYAHLSYWNDRAPLWFILQPIFPEALGKTEPPKAWSNKVLTVWAIIAYLVYLAAIAGFIWFMVTVGFPFLKAWITKKLEP